MMPADMKAHNEQLIEEFRANGGPPEGRPLLLLTTIGRHSGQRRTTPMMHLQVSGRDVVIASNNGASRDPDDSRGRPRTRPSGLTVARAR